MNKDGGFLLKHKSAGHLAAMGAKGLPAHLLRL